MKPIQIGDRLRIKPEWCDTPDEASIECLALEDEDGGRVLIQAQVNLPIKPTQVVTVAMVEHI